ncbi:monovalent cation/H+ antiporter subunit D family protein [Nesterenkonia flava]|uniref:Monovalent cation/H+ antiporter subunit D family protein n=1 Tax=Nesterenkonia flava TaxID=469799 RepID=A0ABU1FUX2_9MICC|nr:monovalent cation/H+ antiporter subunit D family protein [Nesterenkonia flava]MDR5711993.1 monovalent cation/H+ antiporter subunit D family protein [Nesterenkonia flava]
MNPEVLAATLPAFLWLPILTAAVTLLAKKSENLQRFLALTTHALILGGALISIAAVSDGIVIAEQVSGWVPGISIPFVLDTFAGLMLAVAALMVLVCSVFAIFTGDDADPYFHPLVLVLSAGVYGAFLTGDLFNLFVMIEVALIPSYVLLTRSGKAAAMTAGRIYFGVNLLVSTVLLAGIGLVYGTAGTVNLAELAGAATESPAVALATGVVLLALGAKAALVPVHTWLPRSYPFASVAVTALFSGLLTKIGVYGIFRIYGLVYEGTGLETVWLVVLLATMIIGVFGALGESRMRSILSFHMTSQVGYIMLPLAFFGPLGMAAGIFFMIQYIIVKAALFLACGAVEHHAGTGKLSQLGGYARREPWLGLVFILAALSLVGVPPLSGFVGKMSLIHASLEAGLYLAAACAVVVSLFTLLSMLKIWNGAFWGSDPEPSKQRVLTSSSSTAPDATDPSAGRLRRKFIRAAPTSLHRVPRRLIMPGAVLVICTVGIGLGAQALMDLAITAAEGLTDTTTYTEAVLYP